MAPSTKLALANALKKQLQKQLKLLMLMIMSLRHFLKIKQLMLKICEKMDIKL